MNYLGRTIITLFFIIFYLSLTSCKKDYICPAYQSYYLLDSARREQHFSLFGGDSLPKEIVQVKKTKYGVMEKLSYRKKENSFNTLYMEIVYPELSDSAVIKEDSIPMISGDSVTMN